MGALPIWRPLPLIWVPAKSYNLTIIFCSKLINCMAWRGVKSKSMALILAPPLPNVLMNSAIKYHCIIFSSLIDRKYYWPRASPIQILAWSTRHTLAPGIFFIRLFNRVSHHVVMPLCWYVHHIWCLYGVIYAGIGHGQG